MNEFRLIDEASVVLDLDEKNKDLVSRYDFGIVGDGVTDDTAAITSAAVTALVLGRALRLPGFYAVSNLKLPGIISGNAAEYLNIEGNPTFIQAVPNVPIFSIQNNVLQQSAGIRMVCTIVPHINSEKANVANIGIDLTGFSSSKLTIRLGQALVWTATKGRFNTAIFARSNSPFHYGNDITIIANNVPAPKYVLRYGNGGIGSLGNPNINQIRAWCTNMDTQVGDILLDVSETTQTAINGPTLLESCPNCTGIKAGNMTTIRDVWFELVPNAIDFTGSVSTTPNNCLVERCYFSGGGHNILVNNALGAPPLFNDCVADTLVTYFDQFNSVIPHTLWTRGYPQPASPTVSFTQGSAPLQPQENSLRLRVDHHGRTTYHQSWTVTPTQLAKACLRVQPPVGWEIESVQIGVRDSTNDANAVSLGDDTAGRDHWWTWRSLTQHTLNVRTTMRSIA